MPDNRAPGLLTKREEDALAYVDKGLDNIEGGEYVWSSAEVVDLLEDIRSILLTGEIACRCAHGGQRFQSRATQEPGDPS